MTDTGQTWVVSEEDGWVAHLEEDDCYEDNTAPLDGGIMGEDIRYYVEEGKGVSE